MEDFLKIKVDLIPFYNLYQIDDCKIFKEPYSYFSEKSLTQNIIKIKSEYQS